jgi:hypothetical protein
MPIYLPAPPPYIGGGDGDGWNRLSLTGGSQMWSDECALQPRSYAALWEAQDTRRARYGGFGPCARRGDCDTCPVLHTPPRQLRTTAPRVLVRILDGPPRRLRPELPDTDPGDPSALWTWPEIARVPGWTLGRRHFDEHGEAFWLIAA